MLTSYGLKDYFITTKINEERQKKVIEEIDNVHSSIKYEEEIHEYKPGEVILGKSINKEKVSISSISNVGRNITIEGYIESISYLERDNINIITVKISDKTNSMIAKIFIKDKNEYQLIKKEIKGMSLNTPPVIFFCLFAYPTKFFIMVIDYNYPIIFSEYIVRHYICIIRDIPRSFQNSKSLYRFL